MRKPTKTLTVYIIIALVTIMSYQPLLSAQVIPLKKLSQAEEIIFGKAQKGSIMTRVDNLEKTIYNTTRKGTLVERTNQITRDVLPGGEKPSMVFILNTLEWSLTNEINHGKLTSRLSNLETKVFGETKSGSLIDRLKKLANISLPEGEIPAKEVSIPADTLVKIQVLEKVSSKESSEGQKVPFKVVNDVSIDNKLVVPAGSKGTMEITKIEKSGKLGQNAEIELDFYDVDTIDGHEISLKLDKKSREINRSEKLAIGASLLATALLGPVGLIAGYFVEGEEKTIEAGTEFYCQTLSRTSIYGLELEK